jgi:hypothetical protein
MARPEPRGAFSALEFLTEHPWWFPTPGTAALLDLERRRDPSHWEKRVRALTGSAAPAAPAAPDRMQ